MKRMLALALASVIVILIGSVTCVPSRAADYSKVGVKTGDWTEYSVTSAGHATRVYNSRRVDFLNVSGTTVTIEVTEFYPNGSLYSSYSRAGDISTRIGGDEMFQYLIAAGLSAGDSIFPGSLWVITETVSTTVAGTTRVLNHYYSSDPDGLTVGLYWDKESGLMVELHFRYAGHNFTTTLASTSVFSAALHTLVAMVAIGGAVSVAMVIVIVGLARSGRRLPR